MILPVENCGLARAYIVTGAEGLMVVDVGSIGTARDVADCINRTSGMSLRDVRYIVATHFHIDHIGGIGHLLSQCGAQTKVLFHRFVDDYLAGKRKLSPVRNWITGLLPAALLSTGRVRKASHLLFESWAGIPLPLFRDRAALPYERDRIRFFDVEGNGRCPTGFDAWEVIGTPGHTEDSVTFYHASSGDLICGDLIIGGKPNGWGRLNRFHWDRESILASYRRLCDTTRPAVIYPGHGEVIRGRGNLLSRIRVFDAP